MVEDVLNKLSDDWKDVSEVMVYGFGRVAQTLIRRVECEFMEAIISHESARVIRYS